MIEWKWLAVQERKEFKLKWKEISYAEEIAKNGGGIIEPYIVKDQAFEAVEL